MSNVTLSIVIPVYNAEKIVETTVMTIERVSRVPDEIILVDDGSLDDSGSICDSLAKEYNNVRVLHQDNQGIAATRNSGIEVATGDYICFVDQDDIVSDKMYEIGLDLAERTGVDIALFSTGQKIKGKRVDYESLADELYDEQAVRGDLLPAFLYRGYINPRRSDTPAVTASIWKCLIRRKILIDNDIRFKRFVSYEDDYIMMLELLCHAKIVATSSYIGYYWVINNKSESHRGRYISGYGKKVLALASYLEGVLQKKGLSDGMLALFKDQLLFEKTIDVISNAYDGKKGGVVSSPKREIEDYLSDIDFFNIYKENVQPLPCFHRLNELYRYLCKGNKNRLINGMWRFIRIERLVHMMPSIVRKLKK